MTTDGWRALVTFSVLCATAACFAAVSLHALDVEAGYRLAEARAEGRRLDRDVRAAEQALAAAHAPATLLRTAAGLGLRVDYPRRPLVLRGTDILFVRRTREAGAQAVARADAR